MRITAIALGIATTVLPAYGQTEIEIHEEAEIARMRADVGKTFWIEAPSGPAGVGMELCQSLTGRECKWISNSSFRVIGVELGEGYLGLYGMRSYRVRLVDGREGYIHHARRSQFLTYDPVAARKAARAECERRGQPAIGMTQAQATETCWGKPARVISNKTAEKTTERYYYSPLKYLEFENGVLTAIHETH